MRIGTTGIPDRPARRPSGSSSGLSLVFAILITSTAGFLDAVGFTHLAGLYVSFMSGNSTRLGISIAQGDASAAGPAALVISSFVAGAFLGSIIGDGRNRHRITMILAVEIGLLLSAIGLLHRIEGFAALLPVCVAMGMQNAAHQTVAGVEIGKSFVTGFLFGFGKALAQLVRGHASPTQVLVFGSSWAGFLGGVIAGSLTLAHTGPTIALSVAATSLALAAAVDQRRVRISG